MNLLLLRDIKSFHFGDESETRSLSLILQGIEEEMKKTEDSVKIYLYT